ncbi:MAG: sulfotransferase [Planctomycetaceae bacterium]|nr:sulfotransferase [Planctomycetaceae bacterium]
MCIWHGMRLGEMVQLFRKRPRLHWSRWNRIATLPVLGVYNSIMATIETAIYARRLQRTELKGPPIFVLGMWRSGTTLLHNLMTRDERHTTPTMYRTLFPWHFLLTEKVATRATSWLIPKSRPMDNVPMSWDAPQEDDIALCIMTLLSPYTYLVNPDDRDLHWRNLDFADVPPAQVEQWKQAFQLLLKKITLRDQKRVVVKSPPHMCRIPLLLEMFPDAKFVYIRRNPYNVFRSSVHLRRTMVHENGLGLPDVPDLESEILRTCRVTYDCYERDRELIPHENLHELRFEDLEVDPLGEIEKVYESLNLGGFDDVSEILRPEIPQLRRYKKNAFKNDPHWMNVVYEELQDQFERYGYPSPFEELEASAA